MTGVFNSEDKAAYGGSSVRVSSSFPRLIKAVLVFARALGKGNTRTPKRTVEGQEASATSVTWLMEI